MSKITIENLEGLSSYATSITNFTREYRNEVETFKRTFTDKVEGDQAEAIKAFFAKLNALQTTVFDTFPEELDSYASLLNTYHDNISDIGFSTKAYSDDNDASTVSALLKKDQLEAVTDITGKLKTAFQTAADAMGTDSESVDSIETGATSSLQAAATNRTDTDSKMQSAFTNFKAGLDSHTKKLEELKDSLKNAKGITRVPLNTIFNGISKGTLSADNIYYLDGVQTKDDVTVLKAILSQKEEDVKKIGTIPPDKISDPMYLVLTNKMTEWIASNNTEGAKLISALLDGLGERDYKENKEFFSKLNEAMAEVAITNQGLIIEQVKGGNSAPEELVAKENRLNKLATLIDQLDKNKYGGELLSESSNLPDPSIPSDQVLPSNGGYCKAIGKFYYERDKMVLVFRIPETKVMNPSGNILIQNNKKYYIDLLDNGLDYNINSSYINIQNLDEKKKVVIINSIAAAFTDILGIFATTTGNPVAIGSVSVLKGIIKEDLGTVNGGAIDTISGLNGKDYSSIKDYSTGIVDFVSDIANGITGFNQLDEEQQQEIANFRNKYVNQGGVEIADRIGGKTAAIQGKYDYRVALRLEELNTKGVTEFLKKENYSIEDYEANLKEAGVSEKMRNYLLGKPRTGVTFETMSSSQLEEFKKGIECLDNNKTENIDEASKFRYYINWKYDKQNTE